MTSTTAAPMIQKNRRSPDSAHPPSRAGGTASPEVPRVSHSQWRNTYSRMNCAARVAIARYKPLSRSDGMPKNAPTPAVTIPASGIASQNGRCARAARIAAA